MGLHPRDLKILFVGFKGNIMNLKKVGDTLVCPDPKDLQLLYSGKTKDVYHYDDSTVLLHYKDNVTGWKIQNPDGSISIVEDPGANEVIGQIAGIGLKNLISSVYFFQLFSEARIQNHFLDADLNKNIMLVQKAIPVGAGLECIVRFKAMGSIVRAYPDYIKKGQTLNDFFEITTKNDEAGDPRISKELLLNEDFGPIMTDIQYTKAKVISLRAAKLVRDDLAKHGYELIDIKFEIGIVNGKIILIDEVSAGIMRVFKDDVPLSEDELADLFVKLFQ